MIDGRTRGAWTIPGGDEMRGPKRAELSLALFSPDANIAGPFDVSALVDEEGHITPNANRIGMREEEEFVPPQQVTDVVLRGDDEGVDSGAVEDDVKLGGVERDGGTPGACRRVGQFLVHGLPPV